MNKYIIYFATHSNKQLNKILSLSATIFNGYTLTNSLGGWRDDNGTLIKENSYILTLLTDKIEEVKKLPQYINFIAKQSETIIETKQQIKTITNN